MNFQDDLEISKARRPSSVWTGEEPEEDGVPRLFSFTSPGRIKHMREIVQKRRMQEGQKLMTRYHITMTAALNVLDERWSLLTALQRSKNMEN